MRPDQPEPTETGIIILTCSRSPAARVNGALAEAATLFHPHQIHLAHGFISTDEEVDRLFDIGKARRWSKHMPTRSEMAAYATHRLGWQTLLARDWQYALLLEDDFRFHTPEIVHQAVQRAPALLADGRHMIKLFDFPRDRSRHVGIETEIAGLPLVKWKRTRAGLVGYLISREGAARLLARERVFRVVDEDIKFFWEIGLDIWSLPGNPIREAASDLGGSLLESDRKGARRRNLLRSIKGMALTLHRDWHTRRHYARYRKAFLQRQAAALTSAPPPLSQEFAEAAE
ncbi:glycosyltransferase family 25 protein [Rhizobium sp. CSW-27]|uniref:glycosyltransferase family 25 protein n=1 Tax=Rhizobium sp. CSW-27 TaxID=2839985 RepID=UPI001C033767|nr:glycosyltransferase family 25 protein [Rhizobium sp. CSW-27]MBT9369618.1 glycosyltransferase family 25 protein [Rhizobium sp. CSW-27]